ncbi:CBM35 domain-containing protein [Aeromonas caviae]|uniref:mannan endo-1,4-beta-mannosidase n=1 Tax=Aeromonas caviae TaxID=648 RepID=A0AAV4YDP6_AERCA|nr:CBM35 domain-containing protein [Aeromonas caviae]MEE1912902.1 CBM35 domain-containing protein [Aeromonas caviae]BDN90973.1 beta-1,4 mannanase [Aeromonas caviae]GJA30443.1 beta-1,4 mannanase [Aeromonas caviae]GJA34878.1 beta-1,4 mannanase [Aeromonas caviae]GJA39308.1 beta-1,4 mannanase [Aeromonas caviae]
MKPSLLNTLSFCVLSALAGSTLAAPSHFEHFITRDGAALMDGKQAFRFAGIHAPELHRIEDDARGVCKADPRGWGQYFKWPTAEEQANWIRAMVQTGAKAQRVYVLSVQQENDQACERETHILAPATADGMPVLNEKAMVVYDNMIAEADKQGLRLILPFIDHWWWWGGREQLAAFYKETADDFYKTSSKTYKAYQDIIRQVITRKNTITGRHYYDEKAIMAWETGNELENTNEAFLTQTAAWIKRFAPHQLVIDGTYKKINDFSLKDPNVDIISNHYYTNAGNNHPDQVKKDLSAIAGKKVYLVGEFGLLDHKELNNIMQSIVHTEVDGAKAVGGFIWGFRGHRHDGGFYWHKEYTGHYSYHLPGFPVEGKDNQEMEVVDLVRQASAQMAGLKQAPALPVPDAPLLRNTDSPFAINWMGAPVGRTYDIERATSAEGPWTRVGKDVSDGVNEWDPSRMSLFSDDYGSLKLGQTYYYRVIAKNESGASQPSNVISVKHTQQNLPPVVEVGGDLTTSVDQGVLLSAVWRDDQLPTPQVKVGWRSTGPLEARFCHGDKASTRAWFPQAGEYELTFSADDGLARSARSIKVKVDRARGELPVSYCEFSSAELVAKEGELNVVKSAENQLEVAADGFAGPFASEGDKITWHVEAPWSGAFNLHLHFNGKWGGKKNSVVINGTDIHPIEFPQTDEAGQVQVVPVQLKQGKNLVSFGKFAGDWGYMFVKSVKVVAE